MDKETLHRLLIRQLRDIQAQAEKIVRGDNSDDAIEGFIKYAGELKDFISVNISSMEIKAYLSELPDMDYTRTKISLWQYFILPSWWISLYKDYQERMALVQEIDVAKGKFATLELLVRGLS
jgi:hypothetical protein